MMDNNKGKDSLTRELCQNLPGFDVKQALFRMGGNQDLYISILRSFEQTFQNFSDYLMKLVEAGDIDQIMQQLHTLKGAAANLEITQVHQLSQYLEDRLRQGHDIFSLPEYHVFMAALEASLEQIAGLDDTKKGTGTILSNGELAAALRELAAMLSDYDAGAGDMLVRMKPALIRLGFAAEVSRLEKAVFRYAFDEACMICDTISHRLGDMS